MKLFHYIAIFFAIVPTLGGCSTLESDGVTCSVTLSSITCGLNKADGQDLPATGVAKDEKPVKPFEEPASGSEAATP